MSRKFHVIKYFRQSLICTLDLPHDLHKVLTPNRVLETVLALGWPIYQAIGYQELPKVRPNVSNKLSFKKSA